MSCFSCTRSYGFFCKEAGCPNCGFSFCSKCLKKCIEVPRCNNQKLKVCVKCFEKLERGVQSKTPHCSSLDGEILNVTNPLVDLDPVLEPISPNTFGESQTNCNDVTTNSNLDSAIYLKLEKLKGNKDLPTEAELANRLANLKGVAFKEYEKSSLLLSIDNRTEKEKIDDLLKQFVEETNIDNNQASTSTIDPLIEIQKRLALLRGEDEFIEDRVTDLSKTAKATDSPSDNEDDETFAKNIVEKYLAEASLPDVPLADVGELSQDLLTSNTDLKELPWCTICNEDATIRCLSCGGDLFCRSCFQECHNDEEFRKHESQSYKQSNKNTDSDS